jgi:hypothetical protein
MPCHESRAAVDEHRRVVRELRPSAPPTDCASRTARRWWLGRPRGREVSVWRVADGSGGRLGRWRRVKPHRLILVCRHARCARAAVATDLNTLSVIDLRPGGSGGARWARTTGSTASPSRPMARASSGGMSIRPSALGCGDGRPLGRLGWARLDLRARVSGRRQTSVSGSVTKSSGFGIRKAHGRARVHGHNLECMPRWRRTSGRPQRRQDALPTRDVVHGTRIVGHVAKAGRMGCPAATPL